MSRIKPKTKGRRNHLRDGGGPAKGQKEHKNKYSREEGSADGQGSSEGKQPRRGKEK